MEVISNVSTGQRQRRVRERELPECCICMNSIETSEKKVLKCKHAFHKSCILQAYEFRNGQQALCPMCRRPYILKPGAGIRIGSARALMPVTATATAPAPTPTPEPVTNLEERLGVIRTHAEIEAAREQEAVQDIVDEDERFNRNIDDLCVRFDTLFQEAQTVVSHRKRTNFEWMAARSEVIRLLSREYR